MSLFRNTLLLGAVLATSSLTTGNASAQTVVAKKVIQTTGPAAVTSQVGFVALPTQPGVFTVPTLSSEIVAAQIARRQLREAKRAAYYARRDSRRELARSLRRQRASASYNASRSASSYFSGPSPSDYSYVVTNEDGYITGIDIANRLRRQLGR